MELLTQLTPTPIMKNTTAGRTSPATAPGTSSKEPDEDHDRAGEDVGQVDECAWSTRSDPRHGHEPAPDQPFRQRRQPAGRYHARPASAANDSTLSRTKGASGHGAIRSAQPDE